MILLFVNLKRWINCVGGDIECRKKLKMKSRPVQEVRKIETLNGDIDLLLPDEELRQNSK